MVGFAHDLILELVIPANALMLPTFALVVETLKLYTHVLVLQLGVLLFTDCWNSCCIGLVQMRGRDKVLSSESLRTGNNKADILPHHNLHVGKVPYLFEGLLMCG